MASEMHVYAIRSVNALNGLTFLLIVLLSYTKGVKLYTRIYIFDLKPTQSLDVVRVVKT